MSTESFSKISSLRDLGLSKRQTQKIPDRPLNFVNDGQKRVNYKSYQPQNSRPFQTKKKKEAVWRKNYPHFKISPYGQFILNHVREQNVLAIESPTGTGKTLYLPYLMATNEFKVRVVISTNQTVRNLYRFQRKHTNLKVGYALGRDVQYNENDQLIYSTPDHFAKKILDMAKTKKYDEISKLLGDALIIDEVHNKISQIILLIGLIRYLYLDENQNYYGPKIIFIASAFNRKIVEDYFSNFPIISLTQLQNPYEVEQIFLTKPINPLDTDPNQEIANKIQLELEIWKESPKKTYGIIFRPGITEVKKTIKYLNKEFSSYDFIEFHPVYENLTFADQDRIFEETDQIKILIITNEINLENFNFDITFVIDDMLEKIPELSPTGENKLVLSLISQIASLERSRLAGKTSPGRSYHLISSMEYQKLESSKQIDINSLNVLKIVLQLINANLNVQDILKIDIAKYDQDQRILAKFGIIEIREDQYQTTQIGDFVSSLPLSVQNGYLIYLAYQKYEDQFLKGYSDLESEKIILRSGIALASMLEAYGPSYFRCPSKNRFESENEYRARKEAYIEQYHEKFRGPTDVHTLINIFWSMMIDINIAQQYDRASRYKYMNYVREWTSTNDINYKKIKKFLVILRNVETIVESLMSGNEANLRSNLPVSGFSLSYELPQGGFDQVGNAVAELFSRAYFANRFYRDINSQGEIQYINRNNQHIYKINQNTSFNSINMTKIKGPGEIISARVNEIVSKFGLINFAEIIISEEYFAPELKIEEKAFEPRIGSIDTLFREIPNDVLINPLMSPLINTSISPMINPDETPLASFLSETVKTPLSSSSQTPTVLMTNF